MPTETINDVLAHTDWELLAQQKATLVQCLNAREWSQETTAHLDGILNWIDALQDAAENDGYPVRWLDEE